MEQLAGVDDELAAVDRRTEKHNRRALALLEAETDR